MNTPLDDEIDDAEYAQNEAREELAAACTRRDEAAAARVRAERAFFAANEALTRAADSLSDAECDVLEAQHGFDDACNTVDFLRNKKENA